MAPTPVRDFSFLSCVFRDFFSFSLVFLDSHGNLCEVHQHVTTPQSVFACDLMVHFDRFLVMFGSISSANYGYILRNCLCLQDRDHHQEPGLR